MHARLRFTEIVIVESLEPGVDLLTGSHLYEHILRLRENLALPVPVTLRACESAREFRTEHIEAQEEQYREANNASIAYDAAVLIQQGYSEKAALAKAHEINQNQQTAAVDATGVAATLTESQSPALSEETLAQAKAIAARLLPRLNDA